MAIDLFPGAFTTIIGIEGGFSDSPDDPGNWTGGSVGLGKLVGTKYGISAAAHPTLDIKNLTLAAAQQIYRQEYWDAHRCGEMMWPWAIAVFDCAVNQPSAIPLAQEAIGVAQDGVIGDVTLAAMAKATNDQWAMFMALRGRQYAQNPNDAAHYLVGLLKRLMIVSRAAGTPRSGS